MLLTSLEHLFSCSCFYPPMSSEAARLSVADERKDVAEGQSGLDLLPHGLARQLFGRIRFKANRQTTAGAHRDRFVWTRLAPPHPHRPIGEEQHPPR